MRSCKRGHPILPGLCKPCAKIRQEKYLKRHPESVSEAHKRYKNGPKYINAIYGLPDGTVQKMKKEQAGKCAICELVKPLCVDHNHNNKKVRQLLCRNCNAALGLLKENPELIEKAAAYIRKHL
jgi:Recombination endonuclease VII